MNKEIPTFNINQIFQSGKYVIPIYQRNYAWGESQINQLIQDIYDFSIEKPDVNYYIGTLVVYERIQNSETVYETIDGQQRLTTLNIILSALHRAFSDQLKNKINYHLNLEFDVRKKSTNTLGVICSNSKDLNYLSSKEYNTRIQQAYKDAEKFLKRILNTNEKLNKFYSFLTDYVQIVRVSVPEDTDLNHYFEIINNRGEQLEKHEIIKARMLNVINEDKELSYTFNLIWEACSDMERYVQYGFNVKQRHSFFGEELNDFFGIDLDISSGEILNKIKGIIYEDRKKEENTLSNEMSLEAITQFTGSFNSNVEEKENAPERFSSVINFSNFLLHVLRTQEAEDISLDDKRLIELFEKQLAGRKSNDEKKDFVKDFGYNLLYCKFLFDKYIIKREFSSAKDQWSLKKMVRFAKDSIGYNNTFDKKEGIENFNKPILMLLSMFHVSAPTLVYKHWLNACLNFLWDNPKLSEKEYYIFLKGLAKSFLFDRYLAKTEEEIDYFTMIYENECSSQNQGIEKKIDLEKLNKGTAVENFIFNYLDFILWEKKVSGYNNFEFTFRSSIEHYYPQNPIAKEQTINSEIFDLFGNLCLISRSKNSRLSNHMPAAKKDYYTKANMIDSLKLKEMMNSPFWTEKEIKEEGEKMKEILINYK